MIIGQPLDLFGVSSNDSLGKSQSKQALLKVLLQSHLAQGHSSCSYSCQGNDASKFQQADTCITNFMRGQKSETLLTSSIKIIT